MTIQRHWLLPEYVEDVLPAEAHRVEMLRRRLLDLFFGHGYVLVMPPMIEYLESLLTGTGHDLGLKTFTLVDQLSGRTLGIRADTTPQVARIDAHLLNRQGVTRLCYCGPVLHAVPSGLNRTREPLQLGAELYGHAGVESDIEVQRLMLAALAAAGIRDIHLDIGHVGLFRALVNGAGISAELEADLFLALQAKDVPTLRELTAGMERVARDALLLLPELFGGVEVIELAERHLPAYPEVDHALTQLRRIGTALAGAGSALLIDLAELRGYHYHSGVVFTAYASGHRHAVALGGRYDEVGRAFGRARPATGFSVDLRELASLVREDGRRPGILAPYSDDPALAREVESLRSCGETVIIDLPGHEGRRGELGCDRMLQLYDGAWRVVEIPS
jgi:ATP phosphoribosyltransferase regulatory subunit